MATQHSTSASPLTLGPDDHGRPTSAEEFASAEYVEPFKYERVAGRLIVMAPDGFDHHKAAAVWLRALIVYQVSNEDCVQYVFPGAWIRTDRDTDRIGDIGVYLPSEKELPDPPDRPPDLMFEFVSPGSTSRARDYVAKRKAYYRFGIREYVIVDRFSRDVTVCTRGARSYTNNVLGPGDTYTSPLLPGFALPLKNVF